MVEVFSTNVLQPADAARMEALCMAAFPGCTCNFDLEDCDKIFRVCSEEDISEKVITLFRQHNFTCSVLS